MALFGRLLAVLDRGQLEDALRPHLYAALLSFMQYSQGRRPSQASPHILTALLKAGMDCGIDATPTQTALSSELNYVQVTCELFHDQNDAVDEPWRQLQCMSHGANCSA